MQPFQDALSVFKRKVDGRIEMGTDGEVVVVFGWVVFVGEVRQAYAQLEGQFAAFGAHHMEVDVRIQGKSLTELLGYLIVAKWRIIEGEADGRVVVDHLPAMLPVCVAVKRKLVGRGMHTVTAQRRMVLVVLEIQIAEMRPRLNLVILVDRLRK